MAASVLPQQCEKDFPRAIDSLINLLNLIPGLSEEGREKGDPEVNLKARASLGSDDYVAPAEEDIHHIGNCLGNKAAVFALLSLPRTPFTTPLTRNGMFPESTMPLTRFNMGVTYRRKYII